MRNPPSPICFEVWCLQQRQAKQQRICMINMRSQKSNLKNLLLVFFGREKGFRSLSIKITWMLDEEEWLREALKCFATYDDCLREFEKSNSQFCGFYMCRSSSRAQRCFSYFDNERRNSFFFAFFSENFSSLIIGLIFSRSSSRLQLRTKIVRTSHVSRT